MLTDRLRVQRRPEAEGGAPAPEPELMFMGNLVVVNEPLTDESPTFTTVTANGAAHTKGAWTPTIASSAAGATMLRVRLSDSFTAVGQINMLLDIVAGSNPADDAAFQALVDAGRGVRNLLAGSACLVPAQAAGPHGIDLWLPVNIPSGTRIAARVQDAVGGDTVGVHTSLYGGGRPGAGIDTLGVTPASSSGVAVVGGANTYGSWVEIEDSTPNDYAALIPTIQTNETIWSGLDCLLQIGTGTDPVVPVLTQQFKVSTSEDIRDLIVQPFLNVDIPAGSHLSARIFSGVAADLYQVAVHGAVAA